MAFFKGRRQSLVHLTKIREMIWLVFHAFTILMAQGPENRPYTKEIVLSQNREG
jgi:hypothetical protein